MLLINREPLSRLFHNVNENIVFGIGITATLAGKDLHEFRHGENGMLRFGASFGHHQSESGHYGGTGNTPTLGL